jgi:hypothetical protein
VSARRKFTDSFGIGDEVAIIRTEHGWFDGSVSGKITELTEYTCTVVADRHDPHYAGIPFEIEKPRDIRLITKRAR